jgi:hypothetical protein
VSSSAVRQPRPETPHRAPRGRRLRPLARVGIALGSLVVLLALVGFIPNEPLRRSIERRMNASLQGYEARIDEVRFQPLGLSLTLRDVQIRQTAHPEPAILRIPRLHASVHWKELLFLRVVADFAIDRPVAYVNLPQLRSELADDVPVDRKGWQEAVEAIYPLKINLLRVRDGALTYVDEDPKRPLELTHVDARASNIRNIHSKERTYPSPIEASAVVFRTGKAELQGHADFLARPHAGVQGRFRLAAIPLDSLRPIGAHWNVLVSEGALTTAGELEFAPKVRDLSLAELTIEKVKIGYLRRSAGAPPAGIAPASRKAREPEAPAVPWKLRLDRFRLVDSTLELVDRTRTPDYRLFVSDANVAVEGLSNEPSHGTARATARGKFMGAGDIAATASFRPGKGPLDFDVRLEVGPTPLPKLNDLFRAYGKFDVHAGTLEVFSEIGVHDAYMRGYVKPIFKDVEIYDPQQDAEKSIFKKVYEGAVDIASKILTNRKRDQVATNAPIEGPVGDAKSSFVEVLGGLLENAFVKAILPGFDRQVGTRKPD